MVAAVVVPRGSVVGNDLEVREEEGGLVTRLARAVVEDPGEIFQGRGEAEGILFVTHRQGKGRCFFSAERLDGGLARVDQGHESFRGQEGAWEFGSSGFGLGLGLGFGHERVGRVPEVVDVGA